MSARRGSVTFADAEPNGLAAMLGSLIEQNLERDPGRRRFLRPAVVVLTATDADVRATVRIAPNGVELANGADPQADLEVATDAGALLDLAAAPLRLGLPDLFTPQGRDVVRSMVLGRLRVRGLSRHPARLMRLQRLLSAG